MSTGSTATDAPRFSIFRGKDADPAKGIPIMRYGAPPPAAGDAFQRMHEAGVDDGHQTRLLFAAGGLSLVYVWFKSGYPLPRHTHDSDCLYYVVGGSLRIGTEELGPGDGFFVGKDVPYTYVPGPAGVEVLEFRTSDSFDIKVAVSNPAYWAKALQAVVTNHGDWEHQGPPSASGPKPYAALATADDR